jgi:hypothetical protein
MTRRGSSGTGRFQIGAEESELPRGFLAEDHPRFITAYRVWKMNLREALSQPRARLMRRQSSNRFISCGLKRPSDRWTDAFGTVRITSAWIMQSLVRPDPRASELLAYTTRFVG